MKYVWKVESKKARKLNELYFEPSPLLMLLNRTRWASKELSFLKKLKLFIIFIKGIGE